MIFRSIKVNNTLGSLLTVNAAQSDRSYGLANNSTYDGCAKTSRVDHRCHKESQSLRSLPIAASSEEKELLIVSASLRRLSCRLDSYLLYCIDHHNVWKAVALTMRHVYRVFRVKMGWRVAKV